MAPGVFRIALFVGLAAHANLTDVEVLRQFGRRLDFLHAGRVDLGAANPEEDIERAWHALGLRRTFRDRPGIREAERYGKAQRCREQHRDTKHDDPPLMAR